MQCYNRLYESTVIYLAIILWVYIWVPNGAVMNVVAIHMPLHVSLLMGARVFSNIYSWGKSCYDGGNALIQNGNFDIYY